MLGLDEMNTTRESRRVPAHPLGYLPVRLGNVLRGHHLMARMARILDRVADQRVAGHADGVAHAPGHSGRARRSCS
jgi:hypothetical protein